MADGSPPSRLERVASAIVDGFTRLKNGEIAAPDLTEVFRHSLGPVQRKFLAVCVVDAMTPEEKAAVTDCLNEEMRKEISDSRELTRITYQHAIAKAVLSEDPVRMEFLKSQLQGREAAWAAEDAKT